MSFLVKGNNLIIRGNKMSGEIKGNLKQQTKKGLYWSFFNQFKIITYIFCQNCYAPIVVII